MVSYEIRVMARFDQLGHFMRHALLRIGRVRRSMFRRDLG